LSLKEKTLAVLESNYKLLIKESSNLKDDIKFYQRIMKPKENNLELAVHKVHIYQALATEDNNEWLEKLMADKNKDVYVLDTLLVNYAISKKTLKGYIDVDLYDKDKKAPIKPVWYNDSGKKISKLSVKFKYYQQTSYYFVIDAKSELDHVKVNVTISNSQNKVNEIMIKENQSREFRYVGQ